MASLNKVGSQDVDHTSGNIIVGKLGKSEFFRRSEIGGRYGDR